MGGHGEDIGFHNIANTGFIGGQEHSLDGDYAEQDTVLGNIAGIHSLLVQSDTADAGKGLLHCGVWMEVYELCGHNGTGGVLGIIEKLIDLAAGRGIGIPQNTGHHISRHILNDIYRVVQKQLVQHLPKLLIAEGANQLLLVFGILQIGEDLRG